LAGVRGTDDAGDGAVEIAAGCVGFHRSQITEGRHVAPERALQTFARKSGRQDGGMNAEGAIMAMAWSRSRFLSMRISGSRFWYMSADSAATWRPAGTAFERRAPGAG
jgi:hypothetical protein